MKSKFLITGVFILSAIYVMRCTTALAPKQEGAATNTAGGETAGGETAADKTTDGDISGETTAGETTAGDDSGAVDEGTVLGTITGESTTIADFIGKSVYMLYSETSGSKSVSLFISTAETKDTTYKAIVSSECKDCSGTDDPNCATGTTETTDDKTILVSFLVPPTSTNVDANGFPKNDAMEKTTNTDFAGGMTISLSPAGASTVSTGTLTFAAGKRPAAVGDEWEAEADFVVDGDKTYTATLAGTVVQSPTFTHKTCGTNQYEDITYE